MNNLATWLIAQLDEDEVWAREAGRRDGAAVPSGGVHWQWVDPDSDEVVAVDPLLGALSDGGEVSLRSVERFPTLPPVGDLPQFAIYQAEEVPTAVGGHIIRHDPAHVLADIAAKRGLIDEFLKYEAKIDSEWGCCHSAEAIAAGECERRPAEIRGLRLLAAVYADRPGYREASQSARRTTASSPAFCTSPMVAPVRLLAATTYAPERPLPCSSHARLKPAAPRRGRR